MCNIETGKITVSKDLRPPVSTIQGTLKGMRLDGGDRGEEGGGSSKEKEKGDKGDHADQVFMEDVSLLHSRSLF